MNKTLPIRRGDIYYADLGSGVGSEQSGIRPVLIVQNNMGNRHAPTVIVAPITSQLKANTQPTHVYLNTRCGLKTKSMVLTEQIRTVDKQRLREYVGHLDEDASALVDEALRISLAVLIPHKASRPQTLHLCPDCANRFFLSSFHSLCQIEAPTDHAVECSNCHASVGRFPGYRLEARKKRLGDAIQF